MAKNYNRGNDWIPAVIMVSCTVLIPGIGFFVGGVVSIFYFIVRASLALPDADTEGGKAYKTGKQPPHEGPLLPKPRPNVTRNDS